MIYERNRIMKTSHCKTLNWSGYLLLSLNIINKYYISLLNLLFRQIKNYNQNSISTVECDSQNFVEPFEFNTSRTVRILFKIITDVKYFN